MEIPTTIDFYYDQNKPNKEGHFESYPVNPKNKGTIKAAASKCAEVSVESFPNDPMDMRLIGPVSIGNQLGVQVLFHDKFLVTLYARELLTEITQTESHNCVFKNMCFVRRFGGQPLSVVSSTGKEYAKLVEEIPKAIEIKSKGRVYSYNMIQIGKIYSGQMYNRLCLAKGSETPINIMVDGVKLPLLPDQCVFFNVHKLSDGTYGPGYWSNHKFVIAKSVTAEEVITPSEPFTAKTILGRTKDDRYVDDFHWVVSQLFPHEVTGPEFAEFRRNVYAKFGRP